MIIFPSLEEFNGMSPRQQGYLCYMRGAHKGAPEFLKKCPYEKDTIERKEFERGEFAAILECQDCGG